MQRLNRFCIIAMLKPQYKRIILPLYKSINKTSIRGNHLVFDINILCSILMSRPNTK